MAGDQVLNSAQLENYLESLPHWEVRDDWLRREYKTPGFAHTAMLVNAIGFIAEAAWHHPDLTVGYAQVTVKLQTHRVRGITMSDVELAQKIEELVTWQPTEEAALSGYPKNWIH